MFSLEMEGPGKIQRVGTSLDGKKCDEKRSAGGTLGNAVKKEEQAEKATCDSCLAISERAHKAECLEAS